MTKKQTTKKLPPRNGEIKAIPTIYQGVQLRSRFEAQAALLFDTLGWKWEYEPFSYMLPNGVSYTPDFYIPSRKTIVECRGYDSERGDEQLSEFGVAVEEGLKAPVNVYRYVSLKENEVCSYRRGDGYHYGDACLLAYCAGCEGWVFIGITDGGCRGCGCHSCVIERAAAICVKSGKILLNGLTSERWADAISGVRI